MTPPATRSDRAQGWLRRRRSDPAQPWLRRRRSDPEQPWLRRRDWTSRRIGNSRRAHFWISWIVAVACNALAAPLLVVIPEEVASGNTAMALALVFPLVGLVTVVWAGRNTIRRLRFGRSVFELQTLPGVIGGVVRGTVHISRTVEPEGGFRVMLSCVRRITTRDSDGDSRVEESPQWRDERLLHRHEWSGAPLGRGSVLPVEFTIPYECPPSSAASADDEIVWRLQVVAEVPGVDYAADFTIPVFTTSESSPDINQATVDGIVAGRRSRSPGFDATGESKSRSRVFQQPRAEGGILINASAPRLPLPGALLLAISLLFGGATWGLAGLGIAAGALGTGVLGLAALYGTSILLLRSTRLVVTERSIEIRHSTFGIARTRVVEATSIEKVEVDSPSTGPSARYTVQAIRRGQRPMGLVTGIRSQREARDLAAVVMGCLARGADPRRNE